MIKLYPLVVFLVLFTSVQAEDEVHKPFKKADKIFYRELLKEALVEYQETGKNHMLSEKAKYHMEICSLLTKYPTKSIDDLLRYRKTAGKKDKFFHYWLGRVYYAKNQFSKAHESWAKFRKVRVYKSEEIIEETNEFMQLAKKARKFYQDVGSFQVLGLPQPINSGYAELSPLYFESDDQLLFLSNRASDSKQKDLKAYNTWKVEEEWSEIKAQNVLGSFNPAHFELQFVPSLQSLFFFKGVHNVDLMTAKKNENNWSSPTEFKEKIGINRFEGHFCISRSGDLILYTDRRRSAPNDLDIFAIRKKADQSWTKPFLLSENITSLEDEDHPYLTDDGKTLYFSSRGFNAVGGYDIFKSVLGDNGNWSKPIQLQYPLNTIDDDFQFRISKDEKEGYLVSNRYGSVGQYDIYHFDKQDVIKMMADIKDKTGNLVKKVSVKISDKEGNPVAKNIRIDEEGKFNVALLTYKKYVISFYQGENKILEEELSIKSNVVDQEIYERSFVISPKRIQSDKEEFKQDLKDPAFEDLDKIASKFRLTNKAVIRNIYFGFDEYLLKPEDKMKLDPLVTTLLENPKVRIEIAGHTDNIGNERMNLRISQLRANSVKKYLISKEVDENRIIARGYGERRPMATNDDEKEGRELNRRIEIVVQN